MPGNAGGRVYPMVIKTFNINTIYTKKLEFAIFNFVPQQRLEESMQVIFQSPWTLLLLFAAMGLMAYSVIAPMSTRARKSRKLPEAGRTSELSEAETTRELPAARVPLPVPSVTERTTQLIATENARTPHE